MKFLNVLLIAVLSVVTVGKSYAGGLDRATFSSSVLYEKGTYADISFGSTKPVIEAKSFAGGAIAGTPNVADAFDTSQFKFKTDFNDKFSLAFSLNSNPYGVGVDYADFAATGLAALSSLRADLSSRAFTVMGKYAATDSFSVFGALKHHKVSGSANVSVPLTVAIAAGTVTSITAGDIALGAGVVTLASDSAIAPILGASYEIPKIALRLAASYEFGTEMNPIVSSVNPAYASGPGSVKTPDVLLLEFQSGIAKNTLLFGSIRHAEWGSAPTLMSSTYDNYQLSSFSDSTSYSVGVGRKFSENLSASVTLKHAPSSCVDVSLLAPTCENNTLSIGGEYTLNNGVAIAGGISIRKYKTATTKAPQSIVFEGSTLSTVGIKVSKSF